MTSPSQPTTGEALAQNLEGYARDCIHIGSVESVNDLINAAAIIRDAIAAQPTGPSVDGLIERLLHGSDDHQTSMALRREAATALAAPRAPDTSLSVDGREALEAALKAVVMTIAFLGRDAGTYRLLGTIEGLMPTLTSADRTLRAALSAPRVEPVAWRWRQPGNKHWIYDPTPEWIEDHRHEIELEPLYAHPAPPDTGWQPIETAPKDGTRIWIFVPEFDPHEYVAEYGSTADLPKDHEDYWEGWSFADEILINNCSDELEPTHWMPLPAPPDAGDRG